MKDERNDFDFLTDQPRSRDYHRDVIERKDAALKEALAALQTASRQLTEDHKHVLGGKQWGAGAITAIQEALKPW